MSAFMCSDRHIKAIVVGAYRCKAERCDFSLDLDALSIEATELKKANERSIRERYGAKSKMMIADSDPIEITNAPAKDLSPLLTAVELLKLIDCLAYQSDEFEGWEDSKAAHLLDEYRSYIMRCVPGYEKAPWSID